MPEKSLEGGGWVRLELFDLSHNLYKSSKKKKISQVGERAQVTWRQEPIDEMRDATISHHHCRYWWHPGWIFFTFLKNFYLGSNQWQETFSCLLSCARGMKPQRKQTDAKDVQVVVASQKMEQVKIHGAQLHFAPLSTTYVWTTGKRSKATSW